jgi:hypothetical protein
VAGDSLYWTLELYVASDAYPLSQRFTLLGAERGYLQHAATALVHAASGRVRLVVDAQPDPVTASWIASFPRLFVSAARLPLALRTELPPDVDGARAQAIAFAAAGFRGDSLEVRHFATLDGADSAAAREPAHALLPDGRVGALWTLLDGADRVRGVVVAEGGGQRVTSWIPLASDGQRWGAVVDRLRSADTLRENGLVRAPVRVVPVGGRPLYLQSTFQLRPGGSPRLAHVAALAADTLRIAATPSAAFGLAAPATVARAQPQGFRARADSLYRAMRDALARGDWTTFGRAFDALGGALRDTVP